MHRRWRRLARHIQRKTGRSRELVVDALLTGYLFIKVDSMSQLGVILANRDVFGFISTSEGPSFAPESAIEELRAAEASGTHDVKVKPKHVAPDVDQSRIDSMRSKLHSMLSGMMSGKVALLDGPFKGLRGDLVGLSNTGREVSLSINGLNVTARTDCVELV